jgi:hypothetical protein
MGVGVWLRESLLAILLLAVAGARGEGEGHKLTHEQSLVAPAAPRTAGYPEEPYYDYATYPEASYQNQAAERVGAESLIAAPLIVTAFSAALFGGLLSPAITYGFERMSEYEIKWPEFTRKTSKSGKSRALQFSWLDTLEAVGKVVKKLESVQVAFINLLLINNTHCHMFLQSEGGFGK